MSAPDPTAVGIVAVGDELLAGAHPDLNSPFLASRCIEFGRRVRRVIVVRDFEDEIAAAVTDLARDCATVFVTGGLGPTLDDVTRHAVARAVRKDIVESPEAWDEVRGWFERAGRPVLESNRRQALLPEGAARIPNAFGTAPGFRVTHPDSGATILVGPGPPKELQGVFDAEMAPWLLANPPDTQSRAKRVMHFGDLPESTFADAVGSWMERDANPLVGVTVKDGVLSARCVATADTSEEAERLAAGRADEIKAMFLDRYLGEDVAGLGPFVGGFLAREGITFTVAESCTGGLVAGALTGAPGVSSVFDGSFVTYANDEKVRQLGVSQKTLEAFGAVSAEVAQEMARGALERSGASLAVSVTGIAGPAGGTDEKPVGLVWFGLGIRRPGGEILVCVVDRRWPPLGRERVRAWAKNKALGLLLEGARELVASRSRES